MAKNWFGSGNINFNSTMVRLKGAGAINITDINKFQFHYGTIKGLDYYSKRREPYEFQFHYGTIKGI